MTTRRRSLLPLWLAVALLLGAFSSGSQALFAGSHALAQEEKTLTLGNIGWDENIAVANLSKVLLEEELGYAVELQLADVGVLFQGVGSGDLDAFQDVWMPNHADYLAEVEANVEQQPNWFEGTTKFGLAAPAYMNIASIDQIAGTEVDQIYGIEPGAVISGKIDDAVIPEYGLDLEQVASSTPAMLAQVEKAYAAREPFVFVAWSPHWMNSSYDFAYLEDPKGALGDLTKPSQLSTIVHKDLKANDPAAHAFLGAIKLTEEQVNAIQLAINDADDPIAGVQTWLGQAGNRALVQPWLDAAAAAGAA